MERSIFRKNLIGKYFAHSLIGFLGLLLNLVIEFITDNAKVSYFIAAIFNYTLVTSFVFPVKFSMTKFIFWLGSTLLFSLIYSELLILLSSQSFLISRVFSILILSFLNFLISKFVLGKSLENQMKVKKFLLVLCAAFIF